jgi:lipopolysaccharide export system protein LptA
MQRAFLRLFVPAFLALATAAGAHAEQTSDLFKGFRSNSKDPINVDAQALEISEENDQRVSVFTGDVKVRRGDTLLRAKTIKLFEDLKDPAPKKNQFSRIEAAGNVIVTSGPQTLTGDNAVYTTKANNIVLTGKVVLKQGANQITGDKLVIDLTTGRARIEQSKGSGQIKGVFTPGSPMPGDPGG